MIPSTRTEAAILAHDGGEGGMTEQILVPLAALAAEPLAAPLLPAPRGMLL
jgi:hypothetical protein